MYASGRLSMAICDRCNFKMPYMALSADANTPGLRVCDDCKDQKNPWRLPPIIPDAIALRWSRPDTPLDAGILYPDITNPSNPVPPANTFYIYAGLEGNAGYEGFEGGAGQLIMEGSP